jgi:hypothetical protein
MHSRISARSKLTRLPPTCCRNPQHAENQQTERSRRGYRHLGQEWRHVGESLAPAQLVERAGGVACHKTEYLDMVNVPSNRGASPAAQARQGQQTER